MLISLLIAHEKGFTDDPCVGQVWPARRRTGCRPSLVRGFDHIGDAWRNHRYPTAIDRPAEMGKWVSIPRGLRRSVQRARAHHHLRNGRRPCCPHFQHKWLTWTHDVSDRQHPEAQLLRPAVRGAEFVFQCLAQESFGTTNQGPVRSDGLPVYRRQYPELALVRDVPGQGLYACRRPHSRRSCTTCRATSLAAAACPVAANSSARRSAASTVPSLYR